MLLPEFDAILFCDELGFRNIRNSGLWWRSARFSWMRSETSKCMVPSGGRGPDGIMIAAHDVYDQQAGRWHGATPLPTSRSPRRRRDRRIHVIGRRLGSPGQRAALSETIGVCADC